MTSTRELEKTLPRYAPNNDKHRDVNLNWKYAIYSIAGLDVSELKELEDAINSDSLTVGMTTSSSSLAEQPDLAGHTLRDVYDLHIRTRDKNDWMDQLYFIVADQEDWKTRGLLVVHLDTGVDEEDNRIGVGRCGFDWADSWGANFSIGNTSWMDLKEEEQHEWGGDDPYEAQSEQKKS